MYTPRAALQRHLDRGAGKHNMSLSLVSHHSGDRQAVETSIMRKFERAYGAHLTHFLPDLLRLDVAGELGAVAGIRAARGGALFLEQYLDRPVEQAVARAFMTPVDRDGTVEIGNLAANVPGLAYSLFAALATTLSAAGYRWVVCTATPQVALMLSRMGFSAQAICPADPSLLESDSTEWGEYYTTRPRVMAGDVQLAAAQVAGNPEIAAQIEQLRQPIAQMAAQLQTAGR
jgi:hypothetical protein